MQPFSQAVKKQGFNAIKNLNVVGKQIYYNNNKIITAGRTVSQHNPLANKWTKIEQKELIKRIDKYAEKDETGKIKRIRWGKVYQEHPEDFFFANNNRTLDSCKAWYKKNVQKCEFPSWASKKAKKLQAYTPDEDRFILKNARQMKWAEIGDKLNPKRSWASVKWRFWFLTKL